MLAAEKRNNALQESSLPTNSIEIELSDLILHTLEQLGVDYLFGIPGGAIEPLYNALARSEGRGQIQAILAKHETGAAFMADGYYRRTGKLGVCCSTTGPGATNLITGVASAYENNIPMLVITAQTALPSHGRGGFQESSCTGINTLAMFEHCTRYNSFVSHPEQLLHKLYTAISSAFSSPRGPVHLTIPTDLLRTKIKLKPRKYEYPTKDRIINIKAVEWLSEELKSAKQTVLFVGSGCADAIDEIIELSLTINAKIITTPQAKGLIDPAFTQYYGVFGFAGHKGATETLGNNKNDLVLALGTSLGEWSTSGWSEELILNNKMVHLDNNQENLYRSVGYSKKQIYSDIQTALTEVLKNLNEQESRKKITYQRKYKQFDKTQYTLSDAMRPIHPKYLMWWLGKEFPENTLFLSDTGNSTAWAIHSLYPQNTSLVQPDIPKGRYYNSIHFASMGWAIGAAVGVSLGNSNQPVVCITGDGSYLMSGQELIIAVERELPVIFIILNDHSLGMVKHGQRLSKAESIAHSFPAVDFALMAKSIGAKGLSIRTLSELQQINIDELCNQKGPTLLDIHIDPEAVPPIDMRIEVLNRKPKQNRRGTDV